MCCCCKASFCQGWWWECCPQIAVKSHIDLKKHLVSDMFRVHLHCEIILQSQWQCSVSALFIVTILYPPDWPFNFLRSLCLVCVKWRGACSQFVPQTCFFMASGSLSITCFMFSKTEPLGSCLHCSVWSSWIPSLPHSNPLICQVFVHPP